MPHSNKRPLRFSSTLRSQLSSDEADMAACQTMKWKGLFLWAAVMRPCVSKVSRLDVPGRPPACGAPQLGWRDCQPRSRGMGRAPGGTSPTQIPALWCRHDTAADSRMSADLSPRWDHDLARHQVLLVFWLAGKGLIINDDRVLLGYRQCSPRR